MSPRRSVRDSVLIVEPDESIRQMVAALLRRAGFRTTCASGVSDTPRKRQFDVIIRDVSLAPRRREIALRDLEQIPSHLRERTVITTTGSASSLTRLTSFRAFAVVQKPFDVAVLLETVWQCRNRRAHSRAAGEEESGQETASDTVDTARLEHVVRRAGDRLAHERPPRGTSPFDRPRSLTRPRDSRIAPKALRNTAQAGRSSHP
jgi:DNA-binding NtrC family response regulator